MHAMVNEAEARAIAEAVLAEINGQSTSGPFVISGVEERPIGWVFYWTTARFLETRDWRDGLGGNAPILIDRTTGEVIPTGTAGPLDHYISEHENRRNPPR
jgi:hypothetical protein